MPAAHGVWQLRRGGTPSMVTRPSKQRPMPHSGPRGAPVTERRKAVSPALSSAAATVVPTATVTGWPFRSSAISAAIRAPFRSTYAGFDQLHQHFRILELIQFPLFIRGNPP